ncbi:ABC transporter permease [Variovorax soli]|uniref:ABC transporter permease n=1 Tax=Variovorax soli TaxID=376815 RepID=UPI0008385CE0|nr:ABC transporter permease subunit [Variovorax soli]
MNARVWNAAPLPAAGEEQRKPLVVPALRRRLVRQASSMAWALTSIGIIIGLWEWAAWMGWADPLLMPAPHVFLGNWSEQLHFFDTANTIGSSGAGGSWLGVVTVVLWTSMRVLLGLLLGFVLSLAVGIGIRYWSMFGKLTLPAVTMFAPISPVAWLPVAVFLFGIGDKPAVFMVFVAIFFVMVIATLAQIDEVPKAYVHVARIMGATKRQIYTSVILPAILPGLFVTLRINLFAAWMVVLIAEAAGVGSGLGQIVMMARNTFNASLVFFTMTLIGLSGFLFDQALGWIQRRMLWWLDGQKIGGRSA